MTYFKPNFLKLAREIHVVPHCKMLLLERIPDCDVGPENASKTGWRPHSHAGHAPPESPLCGMNLPNRRPLPLQ